MIPNEPAVILDVDRDSWACKKAWSTNDQFDIFKFCELYKDLIAPVYDCEKAYHNSNPCEDMKIGDFLSVWVSDVNGSKYGMCKITIGLTVVIFLRLLNILKKSLGVVKSRSKS